MKKIATAIQVILTRHRIVSSYDAKRELCTEFEALCTANSPPAVKILELANKDSGSLRRVPLDKFPKRDIMRSIR